ncbi:Apyrase [Ancylostoma caninum]|uniref:Apyrase n=1 Tax=Ancylostoma caninum TaxID=29170 RepID=A0A368FD48_ANCCA|nr:Apyrase [Ancylostoma caninum]
MCVRIHTNKTTAFVHWTSTHNYSSQLNHNGRGMELSDLKYFDGKLLTGEWLAVKDGYLYCGSVGKEMTTNIGQFMNDNPMFVKRVSREGEVKTENWLNRYIDLRAAIDVHFPGFVIHEAVQWSDIHKARQKGLNT